MSSHSKTTGMTDTVCSHKLNDNFVDVLARLTTNNSCYLVLNNAAEYNIRHQSLYHVTTKGVTRIAEALPHSVVAGHDQISITKLKKSLTSMLCASDHPQPISIYRLFPDARKSAILVPVYKKDDMYNLENY